MKDNGIKHSIQILEYAFRLLEDKSNEGLQKLSKLRKPDNVIHLKHLDNDDEFGKNTLMACQGIPSLILLSLTVEQTLKLIIKQETKKEYRIHGLKDLFEKLPAVCQGEISNQVMADIKIDFETFKEKLKENNLVFINWRYFYENQNPNIAGVEFLHIFYKRLKDKIKTNAEY